MWLTGKVKESEVCAREAIKLAEEGGHANTIGYALAHVGILSALRGDVSFTSEVAERLLHFAVSKELPFWVANARAFQGWLLARRGQTEQALEIFSKGLEFLNQAGLIYWRPTYLCWVAQAYLDYSAPEKAITYLEQADNIITISEERWMESEVWRLKGVATSQLGEQLPEEDVLFNLFKAIKIAAHQKSVSLELRATVDLVRYLIQIRQTTKARDWLLKFFKTNSVESSDTEVKEAKAILEKLDDNIR